jgi:hypothetical protein
MHTPEDGLTSYKSVQTIMGLIEKNKGQLQAI